MTQSGRPLCLIRQMQQMEVLGEPITNEYDCPILTMTATVQEVPVSNVLRAVSVVHQCGESCTFENMACTTRTEREQVSCNKLTYIHDFNNNMYCLNVYCMVWLLVVCFWFACSFDFLYKCYYPPVNHFILTHKRYSVVGHWRIPTATAS